MIAMHPGEYLQELVEAKGLSQRELADSLSVSPSTVSRILNEEMAITAETAVKLERLFKRSAESWMKMQSLYDLNRVRSLENVA